MILAAGLSPAWQQVLLVERLRPGDVNRAIETHWCASGKVLNVGLALHYLSGGVHDRTYLLSTLGGQCYDLIEGELSSLGIWRRWIRTESPTRTCTTVLDLSGQYSATELVENSGPMTARELAEFEEEFINAASHADAIVMTGSTSTNVPVDFFKRLSRRTTAPTVLDVRGAQLLAALESQPFLVKPNREELAQTLGRPIVSDDDLRSSIAELQRRGAQWVVVSSGNEATWIGHAGSYYQQTPVAVDVIVNPIGCGDCLAAGIGWALGNGADVLEAVSVGTSLAAKNLGTLLPSRFQIPE